MDIFMILYIFYLIGFYLEIELDLFSPAYFSTFFLGFILVLLFGGVSILDFIRDEYDIVNSVVFGIFKFKVTYKEQTKNKA